MNFAKLILLSAIYCLTLYVAPATAQVSGGDYEKDLAQEGAKLEAYMKWLRPLHEQYGDSSLKSVEQQVRFRVSNEPVPNAWVGRDSSSGQYTIFMTAQYRLLITYLADADVVSSISPGFFQCRQAYVETLFRSLASNRQRSASGLPPRRLLAPEVYLDTASASCRQFKGQFPIDPKYRQRRDNAVNIVVALGYLHELGHIAQGHQLVSLASIDQLPTNSQRLNEFIQLMSRSRAQETQADDWAIDKFVDLSPNPFEAVTNVLSTFYLAFGGFDCSLEAADTHPNGFQRFARQMRRMKDRASAAGKFPGSKDIANIIDDASKLAEKAQQSLECPVVNPK